MPELIITAPKDQDISGYFPHDGWYRARWDEARHCWYNPTNYISGHPTHWFTRDEMDGVPGLRANTNPDYDLMISHNIFKVFRNDQIHT